MQIQLDIQLDIQLASTQWKTRQDESCDEPHEKNRICHD